MDRLEMIEELRKRADIGYEEARDILEQAGGNLLEAVVLLEQQGKIRQQEPAGNETEGAAKEASAESAAKTACETGPEVKEKKRSGLGKAFHTAGNFLAHTSFHVTQAEKEILVMPSWSFALLLFFFWHTIVPIMLIALFFNVRYFFDGTPDTEAANEILNKAGSFADGFDDSLKRES